MGPSELLAQAAAGAGGPSCSAGPQGGLLGGAAVTVGSGEGCVEGTGDHWGFFSFNGEQAHAAAWLRRV